MALTVSALCPWCGAYSPKQCELAEELGNVCPWVDSGEYEDSLAEDEGLGE